MPRLVALILSVVFAVAVALGASLTPEPRPVAPGQFSARTAMIDVRAIAARPHPLGSAEHDRVRDYLVGRFRQLGLEARVQEGHAIETGSYGGESYLEGGRVQNIVARLAGRRPTEPALAVMAHYDTVASSPGAADDTVGVAAALETARLMKAGPAPERDVLFVITDGEEAGLLGARSFFAEDPEARRIGAVLNMEARGGGGRVYMFETGPQDGAMIGLYRKAAVNPTASSLSGYVYSLMPNSTDFSVSRKQGMAGLNFAFIGRPFDYHAASSTPDNLDQGSLQHMGDQVLSAARALAAVPRLPGKAPDVVYSDLLGGPLVVYPAWVGWGLLVLAAALGGFALARAFKAEPFRLLDALRGAGALLLTAALAGGLTWLVRQGTGVPPGFTQGKALMARFGLYEAALALAGLGAVVLAFRVAGLGGGRFWSALAGAFGLGLVLAAALQALAPLTGFLLAWPLLVAAVLAAAASLRWNAAWTSPSFGIFAAVVGALGLGQLLYIAHPITLGVGADLPEVVIAILLPAALVLFPLLWPAPGERGRSVLAGFALALAVALTLFLRFTDPWSPRHPRPTELIEVAKDDGSVWLASPGSRLDPWSARAIGGAPKRIDLQPFADAGQAASAKATIPAADPTTAAVSRTPDGRVTISLKSGNARKLLLDVRTAGRATAPVVDGLTAPVWSGPGRWTHLTWHAPKGGLTVSFLAPKGPVEIRWAQISDGWTPPPRPAGAMPWRDSDSVVRIGSARSD